MIGLVMRRRIFVPSVIAIFFACACGGASKPAEPAKHSEPDRCKGVYRPPICAGVDRHCEVDENGCERCTCSSPQPLAPGPDGPR